MTRGDVLTIDIGNIQKGKPVGLDGLVSCANGWRFGQSCESSDGNTASLSVSQVSQGPDRTILNIERVWRIYCTDGGYVGLGEGEDRLVLLHDYWIEFMGSGSASNIVDRLVRSARMRPASDAK
jgi:hypothetical protein